MTREEAIRQLDGADVAVLNRDFFKFNQAIIMAISALRQQERFGEANKTLSLAELRQMDGEPVWIKLFDPDEEFWVLRNEWVDTRNPEPMILFHMRWYSHADYGKTWLAYRQKPEDGTE